MPTIEINGQALFYHQRLEPETGVPPLVLIHGLSGQHINWPPQIRHMQGLTVYALDLPGHGRSEGDGCQRIEEYAEVASQFMHALGLPPAIIAGHSMGGAVAQQIALDYPEQVAGLILMAVGSQVRVSDQLLTASSEEYEEVIDFLIDRAYSPETPDPVKRVGQRLMQQAGYQVTLADLIACDCFDSSSRLGSIACPTLIIGGRYDLLTPPNMIRRLGAHIPDSEMVLLPEGGHMFPVEYPLQVVQIVAEWLAERWGYDHARYDSSSRSYMTNTASSFLE